jgi:hypothetical protein
MLESTYLQDMLLSLNPSVGMRGCHQHYHYLLLLCLLSLLRTLLNIACFMLELILAGRN